MNDLPIIADFSMPSLGIDLKDYRNQPPEDHQAAVQQAAEETKQITSDDNIQTFVLCSEDTRIQQFRHDEFIKAKDLGLVTNFQELDEQGLGISDDYVPDARYPDHSLLIYKDDVLIGSFMLLKLRFNAPVNEIIEARATPWPALNSVPGRNNSTGDIWSQLMNHLLDNDLPFRNDANSLDIIEWIFPVDRPELDLFKNSDVSGHPLEGLKPPVVFNRDTVKHPGSGIHKHIRRQGKIWEPDS